MRCFLWTAGIILIPIMSQAALPPAYLSVPEFQQCLSQAQEATYTHWCIPANQPAGCPNDSWAALQSQSLPAC